METLSYGSQRGWVQLVYGHRGRDPELSLEPIAHHLETLLPRDARGGQPIAFVGEWLDDDTGNVLTSAADQVANLPDGSIAVLENTRRYTLEQALWKAHDDALADIAPKLANYVNTVTQKLGRVHVNEGFAASNRDLSSTLVPLGCDHVALGHYVDVELTRHVTRTRQADLVVFSGIKINKLDDLEQILARGTVRMVIAAGGLALALKVAAARQSGSEFGLGLASDPAHSKIHIPPERLEQADRCTAGDSRPGSNSFCRSISYSETVRPAARSPMAKPNLMSARLLASNRPTPSAGFWTFIASKSFRSTTGHRLPQRCVWVVRRGSF
ncbi:MAG: hypothetical protein CM1200mP2_36050 [Planctomycetaceae bacterium]|nr:MAG: hypothetical protein CM1200mP2_36050 [Planctomycetaceae bacterium]